MVGDKVEERKIGNVNKTGGSVLMSALKQAEDQTLHYNKTSVYVQGLDIFHNSFPPCALY